MISVAMATYNGEKYVLEQINSILAQSYQDFEIIICDDCSTDRTRDILEKLAEQDKRIKLYFNQENLGFKRNFEKAITLSNGEYVAFSDQDDIWTPNHLEVLIDNIGTADISCADSLYVTADINSMERTFKQAVELNAIPEQNDCFLHIFFNSNYVQGACMLMKTSFAKKYLPIPENVSYHDCWYSMNAALDNGIIFTDTIINRYRQHGKNVTANVSKSERIKKIFNLFILHKGFYSDRFYYLEELEKCHPGLENTEFDFAKDFISARRNNKTFLRHKIYLKRNFYRITSFSSKKYFFEKWIKWKNWTPAPLK